MKAGDARWVDFDFITTLLIASHSVYVPQFEGLTAPCFVL